MSLRLTKQQRERIQIDARKAAREARIQVLQARTKKSALTKQRRDATRSRKRIMKLERQAKKFGRRTEKARKRGLEIG